MKDKQQQLLEFIERNCLNSLANVWPLIVLCAEDRKKQYIRILFEIQDELNKVIDEINDIREAMND